MLGNDYIIYSLTRFSKWNEFDKSFLKKFYHMYKTVKIRNAINQFQEGGGEPF